MKVLRTTTLIPRGKYSILERLHEGSQMLYKVLRMNVFLPPTQAMHESDLGTADVLGSMGYVRNGS
jgi:hypothetical protein